MSRDTTRPRHGRRFEPIQELELLPAAQRICQALPRANHGMTIIREMTGPFGIPDLTAVVGPQSLIRDRISSPISPLLNEIDAAVVAVARARVGRTILQLATDLGWPEETVRRRIPNLIKSGALFADERERLRRNPVVQPLGRVYAVEVKIDNWHRALQQARTYSTWADSYVIVMGQLSKEPLNRLAQEVTSDQGGLVVNGKWVRRPTVHKLDPGKRLWAAEHVVNALRP